MMEQNSKRPIKTTFFEFFVLEQCIKKDTMVNYE